MQVIDSAASSFRDRLIEIIDDRTVRKKLGELKESDEFIEKLVKDYIDEIAPSFENVPIMTAKYKKLEMLGDSAISLVDCVDYAYIIFLLHLFSNPYTVEWAKRWVEEKHERHPSSTLLRFLNARVILSASQTPADENIQDEVNKEKKTKMQEKAFRDLKDVLTTEPESVIYAMHKLDEVMLYTFRNHKNILSWYYKNLHERLFREVPKGMYPNAVSSFYHAICADYCRIAGDKDRQEDELKKALELYNNNSLALVQKAYNMYIAYITLKDDPKENRKNAEKYRKEAEEMLNKSLSLVKTQFDDVPITRISVQATAHAGLGYLYSKRGDPLSYRKAESCYQEAIKTIEDSSCSESPFLQYMKSFIKLNRGRNRLDKGKFKEAEKDFDEASKEPDLLAYVEINRGILYHKQSFNRKAKSKFNHAIKLKSDLAEAYYNLGVIYNEEGKKEKAIRLFDTALDINEDLTEAHDALKKLQGLEVQDIRDWYKWWFGKEATRYKKGLGIVFVALILIGIASTIYAIHTKDSGISSSIFGGLAFALIFLILPLITKLKLGTIEVEMESKGERPVSYSTGPILKSV
jgi:tetratricopeptide (TPR) repeat protein